jgi:hypothetical protein
MSTARLKTFPGIRVFQVFAAAVSVGTLLLSGCAVANYTFPSSVSDVGPVYKPSNIYKLNPWLSPQIRRVVLLPLTTTTPTAFMTAGVETLEGDIYAELVKTKRFEVIPVTREFMQQYTGRPSWRTDEELPANFFQRIHEATACDAVLFAQLTRFQPYQPLSVGWKFSLVQILPVPGPTGGPAEIKFQTYWSADEMLDSGDPTVTTGARAYYNQHLRNEAPAADVSTMTSSPTRFGEYTLHTLLTTLPERPVTGSPIVQIVP